MFSICVHFTTGMSIRAYREFTLYKRTIYTVTCNISLGNRLVLEEDVEEYRQAESGCDRGWPLGTLLFKGEELFFSLKKYSTYLNILELMCFFSGGGGCLFDIPCML